MPKPSESQRILEELLETANDLSAYGLLSKHDLARLRLLSEQPPEYTPAKVLEIRTEIAKMSQAAFARFLNVSQSTVRRWESPAAEKRPSGAAAKLLQIIESKGINALMP